MNEHEQTTCNAIEELLFVATGRQRSGRIDDVLLRIICNSEFAAIAQYPSDGLGVDDAEKLADALWRVIASSRIDDPISIQSTIPGISGESTRFDFAEMWAENLMFGTAVPDADSYRLQGIPWTESTIPERFQEYLVSMIANYCVNEVCNEFFSFRQSIPCLKEFCDLLGDETRFSKISGKLLSVLAIVEEHYCA